MRKARKSSGKEVTDLNQLFLGFLGLEEPWFIRSTEWDPLEGRIRFFKTASAKARGYLASTYEALSYSLVNARMQLRFPWLWEVANTGR